jgi:exosortase F-associated protein
MKLVGVIISGLYVLLFYGFDHWFLLFANISYENQNGIVFYSRRFISLTHFLLLFVAGFYYQKKGSIRFFCNNLILI